MKKNRDDLELKKGLAEPITIPEEVETRVQSTYRTIREKNSSAGVKRRRINKWIAAAAALILMSTTTIGVLATNGFFTKEVVEEEGTIRYKFDLDYELIPGEFKTEVAYLPEGYQQQEENKYWSEENWGHGITVFPVMNTVVLEEMNKEFSQEGVEKVEETTLSGMEAHVITFKEEEKYKAHKYIYLFNPEEGYVLQIYGDYVVPMEELKKFADQLTVTRIQDVQYASDEEQAEKVKAEAEQQKFEEEWNQKIEERDRVGLREEELIKPGEEGRADASGAGYTVVSAQFTDRIPRYDENGFIDYSEIEPWLNEDGTLRPYIRQHRDEEGNLLKEEEVNQQFLEVKVRAKKYSIDEENEYSSHTALDATLQQLVKREDGSYTWPKDSYSAVPNQDYYLQTDHRCIYFDQPEFVEDEVRNQFFYRTMDEGDELEYSLIFVVDEDMKDSVVLDFNGFAASEIDKPVYFCIS